MQARILAERRRQSLASLSRRRRATVITLIHRQETMSLLGFPVVRYIDIDDSHGILRVIRETPHDRPIEIVLHTPAVSCSPRHRSRTRSPTIRRR